MRQLALLLLLCLVACNGNKRLDKLPYTPDRVDGSYQGVAWLTSAPDWNGRKWWRHSHVDPQLCPHTTNGVLEIGDHTLYYAYAPNLTFNAPVKADGSITQTLGAAMLAGTVKHGTLRFDVVTPVCTAHFTGSYVWNHS